VEKKSFRFQVKEFNEATGEFEGIASAYRKTPDKVKDIVEPGAFTKTIQENTTGVMLTFPPHNIDSPVGSGPITDSPEGLIIRGSILRGIQKGEEAYLLMKAGVIRTLSIGYEAIKWEIKNGVRHLQEIKLYEVGLVPGILAADDMAVVKQNVKTMTFNEALTNTELMNKLWRIFSTLEDVVSGILRDENETDKSSALRAVIGEFSDTFTNWIDAMSNGGFFKTINTLPEIKAGRILPSANKERIKGAIDTLSALLNETRDEPEPGESTLPPMESKEAARIESAMARLQGFDANAAESRISQILEKIGATQHG